MLRHPGLKQTKFLLMLVIIFVLCRLSKSHNNLKISRLLLLPLLETMFKDIYESANKAKKTVFIYL